MNPLLLIIKYILKKKNIDNNDDSIDEFFDNGLSFPQFISVILDVERIPKIDKNPKKSSAKAKNNEISLQFLYQNNEALAKLKLKYDNEQDKSILLLSILTNQCFKIDINEIISKCNFIVQPLNINFEEKSDIISINCLISLLNVLTDGKVQIYKNLDTIKNYDEFLFQIFEEAHAPLVINKSSLDPKNESIFLIQIEILFDFFSEKIKQIEIKSKNNISETINLKEDDEGEEESNGEINDPKQYIKILNDDWQKIDERRRVNKINNENDAINIEEELEKALLKTLNLIGKGKFHFNNLHDSVINDSIPKFVMFFFNIKTIKNVHIKTKKSPQENTALSKEEVENIKYVIEFLSTKEIRFKILKFDFEDPSTEENSSFIFYSNFLNYFFIKSLKSEIYERCANILCTKKMFKNYDDHYELIKPRTFAALLHFYSEQNLNFNINNFPIKAKEIEKYFTDAKIPMIINDTILGIGYGDLMADSVYYQYQIIFDAIDSGPKSLRVLELFLSVIHKLKKMDTPKFEELAENILAKRTSMEFEHLYNSSSPSFSCDNQSESQNNSIIVDTFKIRHKKSFKNESNKECDNHYDEFLAFQKSSFDKFWNKTNPNFCFDNGIFYDQNDYNANKIQFQQNWINEIANIQVSSHKLARKKKHDFSEGLSMGLESVLTFKNSQTSFNAKLYKIFCYDETNKKWVYNPEVFQQFAKDKRINIDESRTPIVLLLSSHETDSISFMTNMINGLYPILDSEQDIFIYSFCEKALSMLNYIVDFSNKEKSAIKPIFLLLHIPKSKENLPNLQQIIFEIYTFLFFISSLNIVILDKNYYKWQIDSIKILTFIQTIFSKWISNIRYCIKQSDDENEEEEEEWEEYRWDSNNNEDEKKNEIDLSQFYYSEPDTIFLINDEVVHSTKQVDDKLKENKFFQSLLKQISNECDYFFINVENSDSYELFLNSFNKILMGKKTKFSEIRNCGNFVHISKVSQSYIDIRLNSSNWKKSLRDIIVKRKENYESNLSFDKNFLILLPILSKELQQVTSLYDMEFIDEYNSILTDFKLPELKKNHDFYSSEIQKSAESHLNYLNERINQKYFWNKEQMDLIKKSHSIFLRNEFYDIVKLTNSEKVFSMIFEANLDVLNDQINKSNIKIDELFKPFIDKINVKTNFQEQNIQEQANQGVNYTINETESLKEIEVTVQVGCDLTSEVEQDF